MFDVDNSTQQQLANYEQACHKLLATVQMMAEKNRQRRQQQKFSIEFENDDSPMAMIGNGIVCGRNGQFEKTWSGLVKDRSKLSI